MLKKAFTTAPNHLVLPSREVTLDRWRGIHRSMTDTATYTPLECLLLFQSLVAYGTEDQDFQRISDLLTNNPIVKDGDTYNAQRLTTDALRQLYLQLLRNELLAAEQEAEDGSQSRKRKLQSPPLPSIKDAREYREKLPQLVDRLYARYRDHMIRAIREDEQQYAIIQQEIGEIERGEWDERIAQEQGTRPNGIASSDSQPKANGFSAPSPQDVKPTSARGSPIHPPPSPRSETRPEGLTINDVLNKSQEQLPVSRGPEQPQPSQNFAPPPRPGSNGPHGPSPLQTHQSNLSWQQPYGVPPPQQLPYQTGPYPQYPGHYIPQHNSLLQPPRPPYPSQHGLPPPHPHVPSSPIHAQHSPPILLPPPNGAPQSNSPGMPLDALADVAGQQYPMMQQQPPPGYPPPFPGQQRPPSANGHHPQVHPQYPQPFSPQPPYQYPPNQRPHFAPPPALIQAEHRPYSSPYHPNQGPRPPVPFATPGARPPFPQTPVSRLPVFTTGSGTRWTQTPTASTPRQNVHIESPAMEPLSPVLRPVKVDATKSGAKKQTPKTDSKGKAPRRAVQRGRAGSTASSAIARSYRSQSVTSQADELSLDNDLHTRHVKQEVATPVGMEDGDTTADELPRRLSRAGPTPRHSNKRKRVSSIPIESRLSSAPPSHVLWTRAFPKISASALESIAGHKNASTFAAPVKERDAPGYKTLILRPQDLKSIRSAITAGHRAATAAAPEDMAPSATSVWLPISEDIIPPKGIINYAQLEKELMRMFANAIMFNADPDRGIGRRWQGIGKGKGDSVGYEIDEDGVVKDTRAMFADVEKIISSLRSAERRSEENRENSMARANAEDDDVDELAADDDSHIGNTGTVKRRRKA